MTIANIDVTSIVETEFQKQMQDSLRATLKIKKLDLTDSGQELSARMALTGVLRKIPPTGSVLDVSSLQLSSKQIHIEQQGIRPDGTATRSTRLVFR